MPTSERSRVLAAQLGIPLLDDEGPWDILVTVDGADELSATLDLIKGGGGADTRFFRMSRSISTRFSRFRNSMSSLRSAVVNVSAAPTPASALARPTHSRRTVSVRSNSFVTSAIVLLPVVTRRAASALNRAVKLRHFRRAHATVVC